MRLGCRSVQPDVLWGSTTGRSKGSSDVAECRAGSDNLKPHPPPACPPSWFNAANGSFGPVGTRTEESRQALLVQAREREATAAWPLSDEQGGAAAAHAMRGPRARGRGRARQRAMPGGHCCGAVAHGGVRARRQRARVCRRNYVWRRRPPDRARGVLE